jgi:hypothetical protein
MIAITTSSSISVNADRLRKGNFITLSCRDGNKNAARAWIEKRGEAV